MYGIKFQMLAEPGHVMVRHNKLNVNFPMCGIHVLIKIRAYRNWTHTCSRRLEHTKLD